MRQSGPTGRELARRATYVTLAVGVWRLASEVLISRAAGGATERGTQVALPVEDSLAPARPSGTKARPVSRPAALARSRDAPSRERRRAWTGLRIAEFAAGLVSLAAALAAAVWASTNPFESAALPLGAAAAVAGVIGWFIARHALSAVAADKESEGRLRTSS